MNKLVSPPYFYSFFPIVDWMVEKERNRRIEHLIIADGAKAFSKKFVLMASFIWITVKMT